MVKEWKKREVKEIEEKLKKYPIFGIVDMYKMPAAQLQEMRKKLKGDVEIKMSKKNLIKLALKKRSLDSMIEHLKGQPALIFTNKNPFELYKILQKRKTKAEAKPGDIASEDIKIEKGPTDLPPGPVIGQLQKQGIQAAVEEGKIAVKEDKTVAKEGEEIGKELSEVLGTLNIKPIDIGISLLAVYEEGTVFDKNKLAIDEDEYKNKLIDAHKRALNLALNSSYLTEETAEILMTKAFVEAKSLALEAEILEPEVVEDIIKKAVSRAKHLKDLTG